MRPCGSIAHRHEDGGGEPLPTHTPASAGWGPETGSPIETKGAQTTMKP